MADNKGRQGILKYGIQSPSWTREAQACRYALAGTRRSAGSDDNPSKEDLRNMELFSLSPTFGSPGRKKSERFIEVQTACIGQDHRKHLEALKNNGWPPLLSSKAWYRAMNCPPAGVATDTKSIQPPCHYTHLCPWCWCRRHVRETFLNVEYSVFGTNDERNYNPLTERDDAPLPRGPWNLLMFERDFGYYPPDQLSYLWGAVRATRKLTPSFLRRCNDGNQPLGLYYLYVVYPTDPRFEEPGFVLRKRTLALMDQEFQWEEGEGRVEAYPDGSCSGEILCRRRYETLSRRQIVGAVGMTCRYPRQLLYGPVKPLQLLLEQKRRAFIPPGQRRNRLIEERAAEMEKPESFRDREVLYGKPRAFERNSGVRLSANVGLFRNRSVRLKSPQFLQPEFKPKL